MLMIGRADIFQFQSGEVYLEALLFFVVVVVVVDRQITIPGKKGALACFHF